MRVGINSTYHRQSVHQSRQRHDSFGDYHRSTKLENRIPSLDYYSDRRESELYSLYPRKEDTINTLRIAAPYEEKKRVSLGTKPPMISEDLPPLEPIPQQPRSRMIGADAAPYDNVSNIKSSFFQRFWNRLKRILSCGMST